MLERLLTSPLAPWCVEGHSNVPEYFRHRQSALDRVFQLVCNYGTCFVYMGGDPAINNTWLCIDSVPHIDMPEIFKGPRNEMMHVIAAHTNMMEAAREG